MPQHVFLAKSNRNPFLFNPRSCLDLIWHDLLLQNFAYLQLCLLLAWQTPPPQCCWRGSAAHPASCSEGGSSRSGWSWHPSPHPLPYGLHNRSTCHTPPASQPGGPKTQNKVSTLGRTELLLKPIELLTEDGHLEVYPRPLTASTWPVVTFRFWTIY